MERLEFLGDAILDYLVTAHLCCDPSRQPGAITNLRSNLVNNNTFARIAVAAGLHTELQYSSPRVMQKIEEYVTHHQAMEEAHHPQEVLSAFKVKENTPILHTALKTIRISYLRPTLSCTTRRLAPFWRTWRCPRCWATSWRRSWGPSSSTPGSTWRRSGPHSGRSSRRWSRSSGNFVAS